ncbi:MAG: suppressor of fused domain protein [Vulcanimicrobiota bacterium]
MSQEILQYMQSQFGPVRSLGEFKPDIGVQIYAAGPGPDKVTLFTVGLSNRAMTVPEGQDHYKYAELMIHLPPGWPLNREDFRNPANLWPIEWLRSMAQFPGDNNSWLGGPSTIVGNGEPPEPLGPNTLQSCLLLLEDGQIPLADGRKVVLYSMTPLYTEEKLLEEQTGLKTLLARFNEKQISNVVNPTRVNAGV